MLSLSRTLFGVESAAYEQQVVAPVRDALSSLERARGRLLNDDEDSFVELRESAERLRDLLSSVSAIFRYSPPGFSASAVRDYIAGRSREDCLREMIEAATGSVREAIVHLLGAAGTDARDVAYQQFWPAISAVGLAYRTTVVAGAVEDVAPDRDVAIREAFGSLQKIERVASCSSPTLGADERDEALRRVLEALQLTPTAVLMIVDSFTGLK